MDIEAYVQQQFNLYHTDNVKEIIDYHDISIQYNDELNKNSDGNLLIIQKQAYITLKTDLDPIYENFVLAHELGHYILHYDDNISFSFLVRTKKNALEREANEFACRLLLHDVDIKKTDNLDFIIKEKGIPLKIWRTVCEYIYPTPTITNEYET